MHDVCKHASGMILVAWKGNGYWKGNGCWKDEIIR